MTTEHALAPADTWTWPDVSAVQARLGVPSVDPADAADLAQALAAAIEVVHDHSTVYHRWSTHMPLPPIGEDGPAVPERVWRGTVDMAVHLYERRGSRGVDLDGMPSGMALHSHRLLGIGRYAYPSLGG